VSRDGAHSDRADRSRRAHPNAFRCGRRIVELHRTARAGTLGLAGVVLAGAALRFYPIWFGLGYAQARPDETTTLGTAVAILSGDPNPHFFHWPSLTFYLFAGLFAAARTLKRSLDYPDYVLIARGAVAAAGTLTIVLLARLARTVADRSTAIVAAAFLAVAVLHVRESHFAMTDVLMTLWATACLCALITQRGGWRGMALAGVAGGLATSTKYSAAPLMLSGLLMPGVAWRDRAVFAAAFCAAFVAASPYTLLDFGTFHADLSFEGAHLAAGHVGEDLGRGWSYHLTRSLPYGLGLPLFAAGAAGVPVLVRRHRRAAIPALAFAVPFYLAIGSGRTVFFRYILPLVPLLCLTAALTVRAIAASTPRLRTRPHLMTAVLAAATALVPLVNSVRLDRLLARTDSRVLAAEWLMPRLRPEHTLHDAGGDYTKLDLGRARFHEWRYDAGTRSFGAGDAVPDWIVLYDSPLSEYAAVPAALRDLVRDRYRLAYEVRATRGGDAAVYDRQDAFFLPIAGFGGIERPGPDVRIYAQRPR
jgi:hypothetical protein